MSRLIHLRVQTLSHGHGFGQWQCAKGLSVPLLSITEE